MGTHYNARWTVKEQLRIAPTTIPKILLQVESSGNDALVLPRYYAQRIVLNGVQVLNTNAPRSYRFTRLRNVAGVWTFMESTGVDVYNTPEDAAPALAYLQTFAVGDMLVLNTNDEPLRYAENIWAELRSNFFATITTLEHRASYLLIAVKGKGRIYENIGARYAASTVISAWL